MRLELDTDRFYLGRDYSEALEHFGAVPVHLALIPERRYINGALGFLDGLLLPGSDTDVDPQRYGEEPRRGLKRVIPEKDQTDLLAIAEADRLGLPLLAICYGMQALNVARGGTLVQDINGEMREALKHEQGRPLGRGSHGIDIEGTGRLERIAGSGDNIKVNSHHHQAVKETGENLSVTARARDGVVECIEDTRGDRFVMGVQWHPELSWRTEPLSAGIFKVFVEECAKRGTLGDTLTPDERK